MTFIEVLEYVGAFFAIMGSLWLALKCPGHQYGWILFLIASIALAIFFLYKEHYAAFVMELVFVGTNLIGVKNWVLKKRASKLICLDVQK